jgi:hypothetical protein
MAIGQFQISFCGMDNLAFHQIKDRVQRPLMPFEPLLGREA